ncbi:serine phosphatase RsbU [Leptospira ryugenii]|uniref:Serine phosphatase RsbU n=1 Tax=Leptospira ryugenii TaxID=1917863 RepID=A0A2P2E064_9LEPT|nr:GAF domain-containing SpoIIE family protein phosphatase [Leptospira ryugenii]GBF50216.1 serine phosphatase RsbU [Leptospira ryugenii]
MDISPVEERLCLLCQEAQIPSGVTKQGRFYCNTCEKEWILEKRKIPRLGKTVLTSEEKTEFLLDCLSLFNSSISLEDLLSRFSELIQERLKREKIAIFIANLELGDIKLAYYSAKQKSLQRAIKRINLDYDLSFGALIETMAKRESRFYSLNEQNHPFYQFYANLTGTKSQLVIPILYANTAVGMLAVDYEEEDYSDYIEDQEVLQLVTGQFAVALRNSLLYSKSQNQSKNFQSLHTAALTLSKLYLDKHDEMIRMILLTLCGIVESTVACLIEKPKTTMHVKVFTLFRDLDNFNIKTETSTVNVATLTHLFHKKDSFTLDPKEYPIFESMEIKGKEIVVIPVSLENGSEFLFVLAKPDTRFPQDELEALNAFVSLARITMENANLYENLSKKERLEKEIEIAKEIQATLLPRKTPDISFLKFAGFMMPARGIGGDYYDYILSPNGNELYLCIGDVSGKGVAAGLVMATVRTILHSLVRVKDSPWDIISDINNYLFSSYRDAVTPRFMSLILLRWNFETNEVVYSGAGHGNFLIYRSESKSIESIDTKGVILGISADINTYKNEQILTVHPKDTILMFTDGVVEAYNESEEQFGEDALQNSFLSSIESEPKMILESIYTNLKAFTKSKEQHDDITMVAIRKQ